MGKQLIQWITVAVLGGLVLLGFQNCSDVGFSQGGAGSATSASAAGTSTQPESQTAPQPPAASAVCNPFATSSTGATNCDVNQAFVGTLYIQPRSTLTPQMHGGAPIEAGSTSIAGYLANPSWIAGSTVNGVFTPYTILMSTINTYGNSFANGFQTDTGMTITVPAVSGQPASVSDWFALDLKANFHLAPGDAPGNYQFALLADDGAQLYYQPSPGAAMTLLVDDETPTSVVNPGGYLPGTQFVRMGCSTSVAQSVASSPAPISTLAMTSQNAFPIEVQYYNGPLGLSFGLLYRQVPSTGPEDQFCETDVNPDPSSKSTVVKPLPTLDPTQLANDGWQYVTSANLSTP